VSLRPLIPRERAGRDVEGALEHYLDTAGEKAALGFIDALEAAYEHMAQHPGSGSARYAHELALPGLRFKPLKRYPYMVFYVERDDHVDVWRVLHPLTCS
jgi:toxin ParE1/3/4